MSQARARRVGSRGVLGFVLDEEVVDGRKRAHLLRHRPSGGAEALAVEDELNSLRDLVD